MILIVSQLEINCNGDLKDNIEVKVEKAEGEKCQRCWQYDVSVAVNEEKVCNRCKSVIED